MPVQRGKARTSPRPSVTKRGATRASLPNIRTTTSSKRPWTSSTQPGAAAATEQDANGVSDLEDFDDDQAHQATTGKQVPLTCVLCAKVLASTSKYMNQLRSHDEDEVQCHLPTCHGTFKRADLNIHLATNEHQEQEQGLTNEHAQETPANSQSVRTVESHHQHPARQNSGQQYIGYTAAQPYQATYDSRYSADSIASDNLTALLDFNARHPQRQASQQRTEDQGEARVANDQGNNARTTQSGKDLSNSTLAPKPSLVTGGIPIAMDIEELFKCPVCFIACQQPRDLADHLLAHTGEKIQLCDICGIFLSGSSKMSKHKRVHTGEKPFQCGFCGKTFSHPTGLASHKGIHTGEKPFPCDFCEKRFSQLSGMKRHERTHTGAKPFLCNLCDKSFSRQDKLKEHERAHTGEKSFPCSFCGKKFSDASNLIAHERTHTGIKPYRCNSCPKSFSQRGALVIHERTHTGEKPFPCSFCGEPFSSQSNMRRHERNVHQIEKGAPQGGSTRPVATGPTRRAHIREARQRAAIRGLNAESPTHGTLNLRNRTVHHLATDLLSTGETVHRHNGTSFTGSPSHIGADAESQNETSTSHQAQHHNPHHYLRSTGRSLGSESSATLIGGTQSFQTDGPRLINDQGIQAALEASSLWHSCPSPDSPKDTHHHSGHSPGHHVHKSPEAEYTGIGHTSENPTETNDGCIDPALLSMDSNQLPEHHHHSATLKPHQGDDDSVDKSADTDALAHPAHHHHRRHDHTEPSSAGERQTHAPNHTSRD